MDGILRALTDSDPIRVKYGATHRIYGGSLASVITLNGSYGTVDAGAFVRDPNLQGWSRTLAGPEIVEMLLWGGTPQADIEAALADGSFMDALVIPGLKLLGPFLDHDNRWAARPA